MCKINSGKNREPYQTYRLSTVIDFKLLGAETGFTVNIQLLSHYKILVLIGPYAKSYESDIQSINHVIVPAMKCLECILKFMIPIALLQKVGC